MIYSSACNALSFSLLLILCLLSLLLMLSLSQWHPDREREHFRRCKRVKTRRRERVPTYIVHSPLGCCLIGIPF